MSAQNTVIKPMAEDFRASLRLVAAPVSLMSARDNFGNQCCNLLGQIDSTGPILKGAKFAHVCPVADAHGWGTHTVFFGNDTRGILHDPAAPNLWPNGKRASVSAPSNH